MNSHKKNTINRSCTPTQFILRPSNTIFTHENRNDFPQTSRNCQFHSPTPTNQIPTREKTRPSSAETWKQHEKKTETSNSSFYTHTNDRSTFDGCMDAFCASSALPDGSFRTSVWRPGESRPGHVWPSICVYVHVQWVCVCVYAGRDADCTCWCSRQVCPIEGTRVDCVYMIFFWLVSMEFSMSELIFWWIGSFWILVMIFV